MSKVVVHMICGALILLCPPQSYCCTFLCDFEVPPSWLISPLVKQLPGCVFLFSFIAVSRGCYTVFFSLYLCFLFYSFVLPSYVKGFLTLWRFKFFCQCSVDVLVNCFICRCVFLMCLWEKASMTSYFSAILILCPHLLYILDSAYK